MRAVLLIIMTAYMLFAAPAFSDKRRYVQPDGTTFHATPKGDEYLNWIQSEEGEILRFNRKSRNYDYAVIANSALRASGIAYKKEVVRSKSIQRINHEELRELWQFRHSQQIRN